MSDSNERGSGDGQEVLKEKNVASTASQTAIPSKTDGDDDSQRASSTGAIGNTSRLDPSRLSKLKDDNSWKQNWSPNDEILEQLAAMGINKIVAEKALYFTGNNSAGNNNHLIFRLEKMQIKTHLYFQNWPSRGSLRTLNPD